jgi:hypothetical protein
MAQDAYFTIIWELGETQIQGPYESLEVATEVLGESALGEDCQGGVLGPLPFTQLIREGRWWSAGQGLMAERLAQRFEDSEPSSAEAFLDVVKSIDPTASMRSTDDETMYVEFADGSTALIDKDSGQIKA